MERNPQNVRKAIIQSAISCFAEFGVKKSTMALIAERAGFEVKDITSIFGNKSLLVMTVQSEEIEALQREYLESMPDATLRETIKYIIRMRLDFVEKRPEQTTMFIQNAIMGREPWSTGLDQTIWRLSVEFAALFEKGVRRNEIRKDANVNAAVRAMTSFYLTALVTAGIRASEFSAETVFSFMEPQIDLLIDGIEVVE